MFLRSKTRKKDGKEHRYWSVVENRRVADGRVVQRHVLYLGEINDAQRAAWCRSIEVFDEDRGASAQMALFPEDRLAPELACAVVQVKLSGLQLRRPRQWGACWLACELWDQLRTGRLLAAAPAAQPQRHPLAQRAQDPGRLSPDRSGQRMASAPGLVRPQRHGRSARRGRFRLAPQDTLYRCLDQLVEHKQALFSHLQRTLGGPLRRALRRAALRPDQHLLRVRSARSMGQAHASATAATNAPIACRWSSR